MFDNTRPYAWANIFSFITNNLLIFTHRRKLWCLEHFGTRVLGGGGGLSHKIVRDTHWKLHLKL